MISPNGFSVSINALIFLPSGCSPRKYWRTNAWFTMKRYGDVSRVVGLCEIASCLERNAQGPEISRHYGSNEGDQFLAGLRGRAAFDVHPGPKSRAAERQIDHRAGRADSRQLLDLLDGALEELGALRNFLITGRRKGNAERQQIRRIEARIECLQPHQASEQQHRAGQQHNGYRNLRSHQPSPQMARRCRDRNGCHRAERQ